MSFVCFWRIAILYRLDNGKRSITECIGGLLNLLFQALDTHRVFLTVLGYSADMDLGTISSWVAAGISFTSLAAGALWKWWTRPTVSFLWKGVYRNPSQDKRHLLAGGTVGNYGDGNAHKVSVWIRRGPQYEAQRVAVAPLLCPGDTLEFETSLSIDQLDFAQLWVEWTPAPLRHRTERTTQPELLQEVLSPSDFLRWHLKKLDDKD